MEIVTNVIRYSFVVVLAAEAILIGRALVTLALQKARPAAAPPAEE